MISHNSVVQVVYVQEIQLSSNYDVSFENPSGSKYIAI